MSTGILIPGAAAPLSTGLYFQVVELMSGMVGQILFGSKPVYQTPPRQIDDADDYKNLMTDLRRHAEERLKVAFK